MKYLAELQALKSAAKILRSSSLDQRNQALQSLADLLKLEADTILIANERDLAALELKHGSAFRDRLTLTPKRLEQMGAGLVLPIEYFGLSLDLNRGRRQEPEQTSGYRNDEGNSWIGIDVANLLQMPPRHDVNAQCRAAKSDAVINHGRVRSAVRTNS